MPHPFSVYVLTKNTIVVGFIGILSVLGFIFGTYAGIYSGILHAYVYFFKHFTKVLTLYTAFRNLAFWGRMLRAG